METHFRDILHTNIAPSEVDCERIRNLLLAPLKEAAELAEEIKRLRSVISQLTEKRERLDNFIRPHLALISPARRLPADVVVEIFTACLPWNRNATMSSTQAPLLLCHVCRAWRNLALSTPRLWASLHIVAYTPKLNQLNEAVDVWLSRSGVLPLSISLVRYYKSARDTALRSSDTDFSTLVHTVAHYSSRWSRMRFKLESHYVAKTFAALTPSAVPILENFVFDTWGMDCHQLPFLEAPSLSSLTLRGVASRSLVTTPLSRALRHLFLGQDATSLITEAEGLALLAGCPNLEACSLLIGGPLSPNVMPRCRMEHLRQLSVADYAQSATTFFTTLDLPNLQTLEYVADSVEEFRIIPLLASANHLQSLSLSIFSQVAPQAMIGCLRMAPTLRELCIQYDDTFVDSEFWTSMTPTTQNLHNVLCPELRSVKFVHFGATSDNMLLRFVQARTGSDFPRLARLSKVHVHFARTKQVDILPELQQAITDGLDFSLRYEKQEALVYSASQGNEPYAEGSEKLSDNWEAGLFTPAAQLA
ncbi:hypothetical protein DFH06DRAFT_1166167 [Mycena polygramma]|nr:hypothetical protein DFH06DRAFT_1166167 [Mycena polygramma]